MEKEKTGRLDWIDGFRGIAIAMVVWYHAWAGVILLLPGLGYQKSGFWWVEGYGGDQGVGLFLVLSGLCLSLGPLSRRQRGDRRWFVPREFFARRCLRILPPYYAALVLSLGIAQLVHHLGWPTFTRDDYALTPANVVSHVLLVHNWTSYAHAINSPFWSLGLEWQWYFLFPLVLVGTLFRPRLTMISTAAIGFLWIGAVVVAALTLHGAAPPFLQGKNSIAVPPLHLFKFFCGVAVAQAVVVARTPSRRLVYPLAALALFAVVLAVWPLLAPFLVMYFLGGIGFAGIIWLASQSGVVQSVLSWRPLTLLGVVSYSVYLIHFPVMNASEYGLSRVTHAGFVIVAVGIAASLVAGVALHVSVERWAIRRETWKRWGPVLTRVNGWTDAVYRRRVAPEKGQREATVAPTTA